VTAHEEDARAILTGTRVWAVVGCSPDPAAVLQPVEVVDIFRGIPSHGTKGDRCRD
jgi:predicted CoA-binding protein